MIEWAIAGVVGGLGGWILARSRRDDPRTAEKPPKDRLAELERLIQTYRTEVTDLQQLVERRYRRERKAEQRAEAKAGEESTENSTGFPQGDGDGESDLILRANLARFQGR